MKKAITVLAPSFIITYILAIAAGLGQIAQAFPEKSESTVQLLTSLPSLVALPVILLSGHLTSFLRKKQIVLISLVVMCVAGLWPLLFHSSFSSLLIAMAFTGLGYGGIAPLSSALIAEHYDADKQPYMLGLQSAVIGIGGACFSYLGGVLAKGQWWHVFFAFLLFVPIIIASLLLPKGELTQKLGKSGVKDLLNRKLIGISCLGFVFCLFFFIFQNNVAAFLESRGLGDAQLAGTVLSVLSATGILSGLICGTILNRLKQKAFPLLCLAGGVGLLTVYLFPDRIAVFLSAVILGFIFSIRMPAGYLQASASVSPSQTTMAITVFCCICQIGQFLSPSVNTGIVHCFSLPADSQFLIGAIVLLIGGGIGLLVSRGPRRSAG